MREYDIGLSWSIKKEELFTRRLKEACKKKGLSFFWIHDANIKNVLRSLKGNRLKIKVLLDTEATYSKENDKYVQLCFLVKNNEGIAINDPDKARLATDKSFIHPKLEKLKLATPYTIIVKNNEIENFKLKEVQKKKLGIPFIIKPAYGYAQKGISKNAKGFKKEIRKAANFAPSKNILFQEKIRPIYFDKRIAWFRVFRVFDSIILCWWDCKSRKYDQVTRREFEKYKLSPLVKFSSKIGNLTGMYFFSTEIAVDNKFGKKRFIAIDYVNDQCDMSAQSVDPTSPPDHVVEYVARKIIDASVKMIRGKNLSQGFSIWFNS